MIELKPLRPSDLEYIRKLRNANCEFFFYPQKVTQKQHDEWYKKWLDNPFQFFYLIYYRGAAIGTVSVTASFEKKCWEIGNVIIEKDMRGKGVLENVIEILRQTYGSTLMLRVRGDNERAIKAYQKCGFKIKSLTMEL
jgi:RimJ/RimL family protein N-acetyltransferase